MVKWCNSADCDSVPKGLNQTMEISIMLKSKTRHFKDNARFHKARMTPKKIDSTASCPWTENNCETRLKLSKTA
nr:hypothetical transcript [Hymenolepis microstoma]